jgi:DNA-binding LytR/AlgR family response regulator
MEKYQEHILLFMEEEEFNQRMDTIIKDLNHLYKMQRKIVVKTPPGIQKVPVSDILYAENIPDGSTIKLYLKGGDDLEVHSDLGLLADDLREFHFIQLNPEFLVNLDYMCEFNSESRCYVLMENGETISVEQSKEAELLKMLENWR